MDQQEQCKFMTLTVGSSYMPTHKIHSFKAHQSYQHRIKVFHICMAGLQQADLPCAATCKVHVRTTGDPPLAGLAGPVRESGCCSSSHRPTRAGDDAL